MTNTNTLQMIGMFLLPLIAVLLPVLIGQYYGLYIRKKSGEIHDTPVGSVVGAALGLLAFMLAFTFQIVDNRYESRKALLLEEVTDIRTTYLRAGLIPEPFRSDSRKLLAEYVDLHVDLPKDLSKFNGIITRSQVILDSLWKHAESLAAQDRSSEAYSLFTSSVNDLFDLYNQRITVTLQYRIPQTILYVLFFITFFSMLTLGYQFGISGRGNIMVNLIFAIIFSAVMWLIFALDRPETGLIRLNQAPMITLQQQLHNWQQ